MDVAQGGGQLASYLPRVALEWDQASPGTRWQERDASLCFVDISGFTALSERLARRGRVGAEELTEVLNHVFSRMLRIAYEQGGSLLKFGGDALLLMFSEAGHPQRAVDAAVAMRAALREARTLPTSVGRLRLRMSVGVHSGTVHLFRVGASHRELLVSGPAASETVEMEHTAEAGEILVSPATASALAPRYIGAAKGDGFLVRSRTIVDGGPGPRPVPHLAESAIALGIPVALRDHLAATSGEAEHRMATIGFIKYRGLDALLAGQGPEATAAALDETVTRVQETVDDEEVTFLATDIDNDGGKIIIAAGVPRSGDDEEGRVLRTARRIVDARLPLTVQVGVNRGHVFAGEIGTDFRRTFTVMGDTVNLAARLMAAAQPGTILTTADVLDRSHALFTTDAVPPFHVKGKSAPIHAYAVGAETGLREQARSALPFVGRSEELGVLERALESAIRGTGVVVEIEADRGVGKSRLIDEFRSRHPELRPVLLQGEPYGGGTPYLPFRRSLRELTGTADDEASVAGKRLADLVDNVDPALAPLAPLLAPIVGVDLADTVESAMVAADFRLDRATDLLIRVLDFVAPGPLLIEGEDEHWFDDTSSHVLSRIASSAHERPWLVALTRRPGDNVLRVPADIAIKLRPIDDEFAAQLLDAATEAAPLRPHENEAILGRAAGNPLFLEELVRVAHSSGMEALPESLDSVANTDIDELPPQARLVLRHASVLGNSFETELLRSLFRNEDVEFSAGVRRQLREYLVTDGPGRLRFRHALLREAAYEGLPYRLRHHLHSLAAEAVEQSGREPEDRADVLSLHFFHAQEWDKTWRYARIAADRAKAAFAPAEAIVHLARAAEAARHLPALAPADLAEVWSALGDARVTLGYYEDAERSYRRAAGVSEASALEWARHSENRALVLGEHLWRHRSAIRLLRQSLARLDGMEGAAAEARRVRLLAREAQVRTGQHRYLDALARCGEVISRAEQVRELRALAIAYSITDQVLSKLGRNREAGYLALALAAYEELGDLEWVGATLMNLGAFAYFEGRWDEAADYYRRAADTARRVGDITTVACSEANLGELLANQGHLAEAYDVLRHATRTLQGLGYLTHELFAVTQLGRVAARLGHYEEAFELLNQAIELDSGDGPVAGAEARCYLAQAYVLAGRLVEAFELLESVRAKSGQAIEGTPIGVLLDRIEAMALAADGPVIDLTKTIDRPLAQATLAGAYFDAAVLLDLRCSIAEKGDDPELIDVRDHLVRKLGIVALPKVWD